MKKVFVLIGEHEGDYGDFYQRHREAVAVSHSAETLATYRDELVGEEGRPLFFEYEIEEVPLVEGD